MASFEQGMQDQKAIGTAMMREDGVIVLTLHRDADGNRAMTQLTYAPGDPGYDEVQSHIAPIKPGETKLVPPFD